MGAASGIFIGLGTNLGDREANLKTAITRCAEFANVINISSIIETPALLPENSEADWDKPFLNQVIQLQTDLTPSALLELLQQIERQMGRGEHRRWEPRIIDLDVLAYESQVITEAHLMIPHPEMHTRHFVMQPLAEIAPEWCFPKGHALAFQRASEVANALSHSSKASSNAA